MALGEAIQSGFHRAKFSGRPPLSEYWFWTLFAFLASAAAGIVDPAIFSNPEIGLFSSLVSLGMLLPVIAASARRLHDPDRTGWWLLVTLTAIGIILLLIWDCMKGATGPSHFGPDPLASAGADQLNGLVLAE
jgi:uncharacterized membrane protein YhaH (DUF805 family)